MKASILAISGSRRRDSLNRRLLAAAAAELSGNDAEVTELDWDRYELPIYDGDLERECGTPVAVVRFKRLVASHDALIIASPEYNGSITPLLKNAIDWASRPGTPDKVFCDLPVALLGASPGPSGGGRGLRHLREVLSNLNARVPDSQLALGKALKAFDRETGRLAPSYRRRLSNIMNELLDAASESEPADQHYA